MITKKRTYNPNIAIHPGETLRDELTYLKISQSELAVRTGISEKHISQIINGEAGISTDVALKFEKVFKIPADFWNEKQLQYDLTLARLEDKKRLLQEVREAKEYRCYNELVKIGAVRPTRDWRERAEELLNFFGVNSLQSVPELSGVSRMRRSDGLFDERSLTAWLQCGELQARQLDLVPFSKKKLKESLPELKKLTLKNKDFFAELQSICAKAGVAVVYTPYFSRTKVNGAVRWLGDNPVLQINSRGVASDRFWFTFFHEIGHILKHGKKDSFLEYDSKEETEEERGADKFAADFLIPLSEFKKLKEKKELTKSDVQKIADTAGIDIGIVVGRLAHEKVVTWKTTSKFSKKIELPDPKVVKK